MPTLEFFMASGWDPNDHMPPKNPDSLSEDFQALLECWENSPEETPGCDWVIPPAGDALGRVVGDDYPHKSSMNQYNNFFSRGTKEEQAGLTGKSDEIEDEDFDLVDDMSIVDLIEGMKEKGMTDGEIIEFMELLKEGKKD